MATTAKQSSAVRSSSSNFSEGQEDIETIAKQISDHAEAIYQTWKARGLAPSEILNCHTGNTDTFGKTLTPSNNSVVGSSGIISGGGGGLAIQKESSPVAELLAGAPDMSNNNLEKLVSSFVSEDKARIAARNRGGGSLGSPTSPLSNTNTNVGKISSSSSLTGGTVQNTLRKFKTNDTNNSSTSPSGSSVVNKPNYVRNSSPQPVNNTNTLNKNVPDVLMDTIEQVLPKDAMPSLQKPQTPAKPANLVNHVPSWPLKNRFGNSAVRKDLAKTADNEKKSAGKPAVILDKKSADLLDEVSREEERLINALKTGTVLNSSEKILPEVITSTLSENKINDRSVWNSSSGGGSGGGGGGGATTPDVSTMTSNTLSSSDSNNGSVIDNKTESSWNGIPMKPIIQNIALDKPFPKDDGNTPKIIKVRGPRAENVPHPELSANRKSGVNPVRPFLTRGSVAERVLIFEKCPEIKAPPRNAVKEPAKIMTKPLIKPLLSHTTLQRHVKNSAKSMYIPRFHFPQGKPPAQITIETATQRLQQTINQFANCLIPRDRFHVIVSICGFPAYWRAPLFTCTPLTPSGVCDGNKFLDFWKRMTLFCHDAVSRFIFILSKGNRSRQYILPDDLVPLIQDVVDTHPGLAFLKEASEFHSRYVHTVIARIYYSVNRSWSGKITASELRRSNLLQVIKLLDEEEDINQITAYFSYEHFYVIYCKFWELDRDHDLNIDQHDLAKHNDHALSSRMIERIFSGCVTRGPFKRGQEGVIPKMTYTEFVWFLLAEEDKSHATAIEYWFRCMDLDGDGVLSMYELEYFYVEQQHRMELIGIETLPFEDCLCQMLDMIKPSRPGCITLSDLKRCKMTPIFFDTFFNVEKYMEHEQRDPFANTRDNEELSDWDRFAAQEYEMLVSEEGGDTQGSNDDDDEYESNIDILESQIDDCMINEW